MSDSLIDMEATVITEIMDAALLAKIGSVFCLESAKLDEHAVNAQFAVIHRKMKALGNMLEERNVTIIPKR